MIRIHVFMSEQRGMLLALAVEIATLDFANVLSVLVKNASIKPSEPYVIDDLKRGLLIGTDAQTHLLARWRLRRGIETPFELQRFIQVLYR